MNASFSVRGKRPRFWSVTTAILVGSFCCQFLLPSAHGSEEELLARLQPTGYVSDFASILTPAQKQEIEERLGNLERQNGAQFFVVTLNSMEGGEIDDFTNRLFQKWGVGQKGKDNGLLLLVSLQDRKARLEVGYGLEGILPDALAGRLLDQQLFPHFKQQRYYDGLKNASFLAADIIQQGVPASPDMFAQNMVNTPAEIFGLTVFLSLFVICGSFALGYGFGSKHGFLLLWGSFFGGIPAFIGFVSGSIWPPLIHALLAFFFISWGWRIGKKHPMQITSYRGRGRKGHSSTGWAWGTGSSGGFGGGFSGGGGGFSGGGGGSSGGGGASGGW